MSHLLLYYLPFHYPRKFLPITFLQKKYDNDNATLCLVCLLQCTLAPPLATAVCLYQGCHVQKMKKAKFSSKICLNNQIQSQNFKKYCKFCSDFSNTGFKIHFFSSTSKKGQKMAKCPNHFISGKHFLKRPNDIPGLYPIPFMTSSIPFYSLTYSQSTFVN